MLVDLHTHSRPRSDDSFLDAIELAQLARSVGLDAVCFTEHDALWDAGELNAIARASGIPCFAGCEVTTDRGHFLAFGLTELPAHLHNFEALRTEVQRIGGALVYAHPYRDLAGFEQWSHLSRDRAIERGAAIVASLEVDAVEAFNGRGFAAENRFASRLLDRVATPQTAGSDAHGKHDVGRCATHFDKQVRCVEELIEALRAGRCRPFRFPTRLTRV